MDRLTRRTALGVIGAASASLLAACSGSSRHLPVSATPQATAGGVLGPFATAEAGAAQESLGHAGGMLRVMVTQQPAGLDFVTGNSADTTALLGLIYNGLLTLRGGTAQFPDPVDTTLAPDLALSQPEQPDDSTYIFRLRSGVRWHNLPPVSGRLFTAEDVRAAYLRAAQDRASVLKSEFGVIAAVEAPDQATVRVALKEPYAPFGALVAGGVNRFIAAPAATGTPLSRSNPQPAGTGPFIYARPSRDAGPRLNRNPSYFKRDAAGQGLPYLGSIAWLAEADPAARLQAYQAQQADLTPALAASEAEQLRASNPNDFQFTEAPGVSGSLFMRLDQSPFNDTRVRQALSLALDRPSLLQALASGHGAADLPIPRLLTAFATAAATPGAGARLLGRDLQAAAQLLSAAGMGTGFATTLSYSPQYGATTVQTVQLIQSNLRDAGVQVSLLKLDYPTFLSSALRGDLQGLAYAPRDLYPDPDPYLSYYYLPGGIFYQQGVSDSALQNLVSQQRRTLDAARRASLCLQAQALLQEQQYRIFDVAPSRFFARRRAVQNYRGSDWPPLSRLESAWLSG